MAQYNVTAPDGSKYQITAPDDATPDQVQAYAQANYQHPAVASGQGLTHTPVDPSQVAANDPGVPTTQTGSSVQNGIPTASYAPSAADLAAAQAPAAPDRLPGVLGTINDVGNNLGDAFVHNLAKPVIGVGQDLAHVVGGLSATGAQNAPAGSVGSNINAYVQGKIGDLDNAIAGNEKSYQAAVPNNAASYTGAALGQVLPFLTGAGEANAAAEAPAIASKLGVGGNIVKGAVTGGLVGASQPVVNPGNFATQKAEQTGLGAATGGTLATAGQLASGVGNLGRYVFNPQSVAGENISRLVGSDPATLAKLDAASSDVPGVSPTTAQVAPSPSSVGAEKALGNVPGMKEQLAQRQADNNAARLSVLQNMAGDDASFQAAKDARTAATQPFIDANLNTATPAIRWNSASQPIQDALSKPMLRGPDFQALNDAQGIINKVKNGSMQEDDAQQALNELHEGVTQNSPADKALTAAQTAIHTNMIDPTPLLNKLATTRNGTSIGQNPAVANALDTISGNIKNAQNINGMVPAAVLEGIRQHAGQILNANATGNALVGSTETAGIAPIKQGVTDLLAKNVPGFTDYLSNYAKLSQPLNDMQTARAALAPSDAGALNSVGQQNLTLAQVSRALKNDDNADYGLSATARSKLEGIQNSLQQESISNSLRSPGSDTAYNLNAQGALAKNLLGPTLGGPTTTGRAGAATVGALIGEHFGGPGGAAAGAAAGAFVNKAANVVNQRIMNQYANGLLNPADAATLIRTYLKGNSGQASKLLAQYPQWNALLSGGAAQQLQKANP